MADYRKLAKKYIESGYYVLPISKSKRPAVPNWIDLQTRPMTDLEVETHFKNTSGIGLLMGGIPRLFAVDFDLKYSFNPNLMEEIKEKLPVDLLKKMQVNSTRNNGFHWVCKIPESRLSGNEKFASRYTTAFEKHQVYLDAYSQPKHRDNALKIALKDSERVLIESRSGTSTNCGGYILIPPTPGYSHVYGKIHEITESEYDLLVETMRSFQEVHSIDTNDRKYDNHQWEVSVFEDYNNKGCVVELLEKFGWEIDRETSKNIRWKRPGSNHSSALYDKTTEIFNCFSTSTSLRVDKGYNLAGLFIELECDGDGRLAYRKLIDLGYGVKEKPQKN